MFCGGQGVYLYYLSRELLRLGHEVHVFVGPPYAETVPGVVVHHIDSLNLYDRKDGFLPADAPLRILEPLNLYEFAATRIGMFPEMLTFSLRAFAAIRRLSMQRRFDIIHDNQCLGYGLLLMKTLGIPVIATIHHPLGIDRRADLLQARSIRERMERIIHYPIIMQQIVTRYLDRVITVSQSAAEQIRGHFPIPDGKMEIVYNGVDTEMFRPREGIAKEPNSLIVVGNTEDRKKGILYLLRAMRLLRDEMDVRLTIVDAGLPKSKFAARLIHEYGLQDRVRFTGRISTEDLALRYAASEVAVTPSLYEGFGFPAVEAMACGVPVITTSGGALPEVVDDGKTGLMVPPGNPEELARAIKVLLDDAGLRRRLGANGRDTVQRRFTWIEATKQIVEIYEEVIDRKSCRNRSMGRWPM